MRIHRKLPQTEDEARAQTLQAQVAALGEAFREFGRQYAIAARPAIDFLVACNTALRSPEPPRRWWQFWKAR